MELRRVLIENCMTESVLLELYMDGGLSTLH